VTKAKFVNSLSTEAFRDEYAALKVNEAVDGVKIVSHSQKCLRVAGVSSLVLVNPLSIILVSSS